MKYCTDSDVKVIVIGQHCWNTLGQIRSFGEVGVKPDVVWISGDQFNPSSSKYVNHFIEFDNFKDGLTYILDNYNNTQFKYIISTDSDAIVSLLDLNYDKLENNYFFFNAGGQGRLNYYMLKNNQYDLAEKCGLRAPKYELVMRGDKPETLNYPIITKTVNCFAKSWKDNYFICRNEYELFEAYKTINQDQILLQEFIEKKNEVALEGISFNRGNELFLPVQGEYLRLEEGQFGSWKKNEIFSLGDDLKAKIQHFFKEIEYTGVFEVEFLRDQNDDLYFLETNFRHTQYNHALSDMGINLCRIFSESMLNGYLCTEGLKPTRIKSPHFVMNEKKDYDIYIKTNRIGIRKWYSDIKGTDSFYIYDDNDKLPFYCYLFSLIIGKIRFHFKKIVLGVCKDI